MERQIAEQEKVLITTEGTISSRVAGLNAITARLKERTKLLEQTRLEIGELDRENARLQKEIEVLQIEYDRCRDQCRCMPFLSKTEQELQRFHFHVVGRDFPTIGSQNTICQRI